MSRIRFCLLSIALLASLPAAAIAVTVARVPQLASPSSAVTAPGIGALCVNQDGSSCAPGDPSTSTALVGTSTGSQVVGPFTPQLSRPIVVALSGTWSGTVQLLRSTDGGTTKLPLTPAGVTLGTYTAQGVDTPWVESEAGAVFYLSVPTTGISYRVSQ